MTRDSLVSGRDWPEFVERLGGAAALARGARETRAFLRPRGVPDAATLLRLVLAYCLGRGGLRLTAAWASAAGLADMSNVAVLKRLRGCADWLALLVGQALSAAVAPGFHGRPIRLVDATCVPKAGRRARRDGEVWRVHAAFDLPAERFGRFALTDGGGGERLDRVPVVPGEIRIADRAYLQPDRIAAVPAAGADIVIRAGRRNARWRAAADGTPLDLAALLRNARREGYALSADALDAAEWVLIVASPAEAGCSTADVLALYRLRWRIELASKRPKSGIGLGPPPGRAEGSARTFVLAHLLAILLLEPVFDEFGDSPRRAPAAA